MNSVLRIVIVIALCVYYAYILSMLKKKKFALKYSLLWIFAGFVMLLIVIFPEVFELLIHAMGIVETTNGLFAVVLFAMLIILISITAIVTKLNDSIRQLTQRCAMYEKRIRELEDKLK